MEPITIASLSFLAIAAGGLIGLSFNPHERYMGEGSREAVRFMQGTVGSIAALVLGLLVASANDHYRAQSERVTSLAGQVMAADRLLAQYGIEAAGARQVFRASVEFAIEEIWAVRGRSMTQPPFSSVLDEVARLQPDGARQAFVQTKAMEQFFDITRSRAGLTASEHDGSVQPLMLIIVVLWFVFLFLAMGFYASLNLASISATMVGSAAVASAIFLLTELDRPFGGLMEISARPLQQALAAIGGG